MRRKTIAAALVYVCAVSTLAQSVQWIKFGSSGPASISGGSMVAPAKEFIYVWNYPEKRFNRSIPTSSGSFLGLSANGSNVVVQKYNTLDIFSIRNGEVYSLPFERQTGLIPFQTASNRIAFLDFGHLKFWDLPTKQYLTNAFLIEGGGQITFSPDGQRFFIPTSNGRGRIYTLATGAFLEIGFGYEHPGPMFSPNGQQLAVPHAWVSDPDNHVVSFQLLVLDSFTGATNMVKDVPGTPGALRFSPDSKYVGSSFWHNDYSTFESRVWNIQTGELVTNVAPSNIFTANLAATSDHVGTIHEIAFNQDGSLLLVHDDEGPSLRRATDGELLFRFPKETSLAAEQEHQRQTINSSIMRLQTAVHFSADGKTVTVDERVFDLTTGALVRTLPYRPLALFEDRYYTSEIAGGNVGELRQSSDGAVLSTFTSATSHWSFAAAESPSRQILATSGGYLYGNGWGLLYRSINLWNAADGSLVKTLTNNLYRPFRMRFSKDGKIIASGSDLSVAELSAHDIDSGQRLIRLQNGLPAMGFDLMPDSRTIVYGHKEGLEFWDAPTSNLVARWTNEMHLITAVAVSPDGKKIAVGRWDGAVLMLDAPVMDRLNLQSTDTGISLKFHGRPSVPYVLESSPDLNTWTEVMSVVGTDATIERLVSPTQTTFYRLR